jgi:threonine synthase
VLGHPVKDPKTIATAIKIGNPASWKEALAARDESKGLIDAVSDDEIVAAYRLLASKEGVFVEPASAASVAGVLKLAGKGYFNDKRKTIDDKRIRIVCVLTGHGLKDPDRAIASVAKPAVLEPDLKAILREVGL